MPTPPHSPPLDSPPLSPDKLPLKRQRRLRVEHFDFSGVDVDITDSDLDFGEAIEENNNESEDISEGEDWLIEIDSVDPLMTMQGEMSGSSEASKTGSVGDVRPRQSVSHSLRRRPDIMPLEVLEHKMKDTAQDIEGKPNARFKCPLLSCNMILPPSTTLKELYTHASDTEHLRGLHTRIIPMRFWMESRLH
jgi:hypothetical protein